MGGKGSKEKKKTPQTQTSATPKSPTVSPSSSSSTKPQAKTSSVQQEVPSTNKMEQNAQQPSPQPSQPTEVVATKTQSATPQPAVTANPTPARTQTQSNLQMMVEGVELEYDFNDPRNDLVNIWGIMRAAARLVQAVVATDNEWGSDAHKQDMQQAWKAWIQKAHILLDHQKVHRWSTPLQMHQTGLILMRSRGVVTRMDAVYKSMMAVVSDKDNSPTLKNQLKEALRALWQALIEFYCACEISMPADVKLHIDNTTYALRMVVERNAAEPDPSMVLELESPVRTCITEALKLSRMGNLRGLQQPNTELQRKLNDVCFTITRATKAMRLMFAQMKEASDIEEPRQNLASVCKGMAQQFKKLTNLADTSPPRDVFMLSQETLQHFINLYDTAINDARDSVTSYVQLPYYDEVIEQSVSRIIKATEVCKKVLEAPKPVHLMKAAHAIADSLENICAHVYGNMTFHPDLSDLLLSGMQAALNYVIEVYIGVGCKVLYHPVVNPEVTILNAMRLLLGTLSVLLTAAPEISAKPQPEDDTIPVVEPDYSVGPAIIDVLHYGRQIPEPVVTAIQETEATKTNNEREELLRQMEMDVNIFQDTTSTTSAVGGSEPETSKTVSPVQDTDNSVQTPIPKPKQKKPKRPRLSEFIEQSNSPAKPEAAATSPSKTPATSPSKQSAQKTEPAAASSTSSAESTSTTSSATTASTTAPATSAASSNISPALQQVYTTYNIPPLPEGWLVDSITEDNLPPGWPPAPPKATFQKGGTEEEYKKYMIARYEREAWENRLFLIKKKLKEAGAK